MLTNENAQKDNLQPNIDGKFIQIDENFDQKIVKIPPVSKQVSFSAREVKNNKNVSRELLP